MQDKQPVNDDLSVQHRSALSAISECYMGFLFIDGVCHTHINASGYQVADAVKTLFYDHRIAHVVLTAIAEEISGFESNKHSVTLSSKALGMAIKVYADAVYPQPEAEEE